MKIEKISIIIPIYNVEKYLEKCLNSIINQTYKNLEIILIDDGSTDKSSTICDEYCEKDKRIKVIHKKNEGVSTARNEGLKASTGKYIIFIDPDDYVANNHIEILYKCMIDKNVDLVISNAIDVNEEGIVLKVKEKNDFFMDREECLKELLSEENFNHVCWGNIYKRELLENSIFNCKYRIAEDLDFLYRYIKHIRSAYFLSENTYYYLKREDSITNSAYGEKWNDELKICNFIINETCKLDNDLHKYAKKKYIIFNINQAYRFALNKNQIKNLKNNIKLYKNEIFNSKFFDNKEKLKISLFLKSYYLFKIVCNIKNKIKIIKRKLMA